LFVAPLARPPLDVAGLPAALVISECAALPDTAHCSKSLLARRNTPGEAWYVVAVSARHMTLELQTMASLGQVASSNP
jgi:hypothetical protein